MHGTGRWRLTGKLPPPTPSSAVSLSDQERPEPPRLDWSRETWREMPQLLDDYYRDWQAAALDLKIKDYLYLEDIHRGITGPRDEEEARLYEWFRTERPAREVGDQDPYPPPVATNPLARALRRWRR